ncbi:DHA2 family efflux MFS transporter permease subunit [Solihabitans fulvus]|uniref:DHA2 family efflux MFS transporter permease subunit n=1 Tax=Solihabitans fulvus TaxID=1892852 RepID=A0A5B2XLD9_9PSEU|nr:DHA2 family efflux MFS transporter permease subunit [Solihabitans fulvus]KAA2263729.1 DHA2 family efflux MFS transporter permease subunit [Solihabitans fulvus]
MTTPASTVHPTAIHPAQPADTERLDPALLKMGAVLIFGAILSVLDGTIVNVGIDSVVRDLHSPLAAVQWVATGYLLAVSMVMPLSGWATERFGGKRMWMISVALFVGGSALCGLAWSTPALIAFRVVQGIGGGMMQPIGQAMMAQAAGPSRLTRVMGLLVVPITFAPVLGPLLGGVIVANLDWRWMFYVNVPIGIATLVAAARVLPAGGRTGARNRLDVLGLALLSPGLAALVYGFATAGEPGGFGAPKVVLALALGVGLLAGYAAHALRGRGIPLIDLRLFRRRQFAVATGSSFLLGASMYSSMLLLPLYYEQVEHASALRAGLLLAPQALGTALVVTLAGRLAARISPRRIMVCGIGLSLAGTVAFTQLGAHPAGWLLVASLVLRGIGLGATMAPGMGAVYAAVERHEAPRAASALNVLNRVGGSLGTAVLVVVLQQNLDTAADPAVAFGTTFWWALGLSLLTLIPAAMFPDRVR